MQRRPYLVFFLAPVLGYLIVLLFVGLLVVHPSTLGWAGFGLAATIGILIAAATALLYPRSRTNARRAHAHGDGHARLLVVADLHCDEAAFCRAVWQTLAGRPGEVFVLAPVLASPLHFLTNDEHAEAEDARARLAEALLSLKQLGIQAHGTVGGDDPLEAISDVLAGFPADEILVIAPEQARRNWVERDLERKARDTYGLHVSSVTLDEITAPAA
jgi:hypothetical protein